eukprot:COSAG01_NODE_25311_length_749_cov_1.129231_1_plen_245_part_01
MRTDSDIIDALADLSSGQQILLILMSGLAMCGCVCVLTAISARPRYRHTFGDDVVSGGGDGRIDLVARLISNQPISTEVKRRQRLTRIVTVAAVLLIISACCAMFLPVALHVGLRHKMPTPADSANDESVQQLLVSCESTGHTHAALGTKVKSRYQLSRANTTGVGVISSDCTGCQVGQGVHKGVGSGPGQALWVGEVSAYNESTCRLQCKGYNAYMYNIQLPPPPPPPSSCLRLPCSFAVGQK